ncbi:MAG: hypothetical protein IJW03_02945 [Clostridia bacterium]|nr:hypothetical protein [Clostridia bacterium]
MWYALYSYHLGDEVDTIKYYFENSSLDGTYTWTTDVSASVAQEIKDAYANSMKKWNDVYFYSYDSSGVLIKHKIINVVEGTASDHNLSIYPKNSSQYFASTGVVGSYELIEPDPLDHRHYNEWKMEVYVDNFYAHGGISNSTVYIARERTGAHELGHIFGLLDLDYQNLCNAEHSYQHHSEVLMGYGDLMSYRARDITYKDIAGVAITRGYHTDNDHKWLNYGLQSNQKYKLVCSICNGVKNVADLSEYEYETYGACGNNHILSGGNMMAVASYGTKDYYKCKYCRYVASFSAIVSQNYIDKTYYSVKYHRCTNAVDGLEYVFDETHNFVNNECTECGFLHTHEYGPYVYFNNHTHIRYCNCGGYQTAGHYISENETGNRFVRCLGCRAMLDLSEDVTSDLMSIITQVSANGSYILPSGIVVLVDEDIQAYLDGTLQFYHPDSIPTTQ